MKGYPLTNEISMQELLKMREEYGMSNPEIASALDVSQRTIWRYIGKGPRSKNQIRGVLLCVQRLRRKNPPRPA